jgi:hypothetical protein
MRPGRVVAATFRIAASEAPRGRKGHSNPMASGRGCPTGEIVIMSSRCANKVGCWSWGYAVFRVVRS